MKKLKIYLDTSVISHLDAPDVPEKMADTWKLWEDIRAGKYRVFVSLVTIEELEGCSEPKRTKLVDYLKSIPYELLEECDEVADLAEEYISRKVIRVKSFDDSQHIAYACVYDCDIVVSWNFKHIVNHKTISGVKGVNAVIGYKEMLIYSPTMLLSGGVDSE